jgi:hypothetical protein
MKSGTSDRGGAATNHTWWVRQMVRSSHGDATSVTVPAMPPGIPLNDRISSATPISSRVSPGSRVASGLTKHSSPTELSQGLFRAGLILAGGGFQREHGLCPDDLIGHGRQGGQAIDRDRISRSSGFLQPLSGHKP